MVEVLRALTCVELFLQADFYCRHPILLSCFNKHPEIFPSFRSLLTICVSDIALMTDCNSDKLVCQEAIHNCVGKVPSSFLCMLALATVINCNINSFYPDIGAYKYKVLFNQIIQPRES